MSNETNDDKLMIIQKKTLEMMMMTIQVYSLSIVVSIEEEKNKRRGERDICS
jgi:hypothetical protein